MSRRCPRDVPAMSPRYPRDVPTVSPQCPGDVPMMSPQCPHGIPVMSPQCPYDVPAMSPRCPRDVPTVSPRCPPRGGPGVVRGGRRKVRVEAVLQNRKENAYNARVALRSSANLHFSSVALPVRRPAAPPGPPGAPRDPPGPPRVGRRGRPAGGDARSCWSPFDPNPSRWGCGARGAVGCTMGSRGGRRGGGKSVGPGGK